METKKLTALIGIGIVILIAVGLAWAGSQGSVYFEGMPLFALGVGLAFAIQWIVFIPAFIFQTEKFFDLTGSLTYTAVTVAALLLSGNADLRSYLLMGMVLIWAGRLGSFLVTRIHKSGKDARFDKIKPSFLRFLQTWTVQGLWISFTLAAALAAITAVEKVPLDGFAIAGSIIWLVGITIEGLADQQKSVFRSEPANKDKFIQTGLWSWSRHPNYFGEILLWFGAAIVAFPVLGGWQRLTLISPFFVFLLLTRVSGIPLLEKRADEKWGGQADYEAYKKRTSVLVPVPPKND
jgi:steroid 5-alpha reductase family enzyme